MARLRCGSTGPAALSSHIGSRPSTRGGRISEPAAERLLALCAPSLLQRHRGILSRCLLGQFDASRGVANSFVPSVGDAMPASWERPSSLMSASEGEVALPAAQGHRRLDHRQPLGARRRAPCGPPRPGAPARGPRRAVTSARLQAPEGCPGLGQRWPRLAQFDLSRPRFIRSISARSASGREASSGASGHRRRLVG